MRVDITMQLTTEKFTLKNLDCAACALKLEKELNALEGVEEALVDFAGLTLHIKARDMQAVVAAAHRIAPEVELIPKSGPQAKPGADKTELRTPVPRREIGFLLAAFVLFLIQLFFEKYFHQHHLGLLEAALVLAAYLLAGGNVLLNALRTIRKGLFFDEHVLMMIATAGALIIHAYAEAVGVMLFYKVGELLQNKAVSRSRRAINRLLAVKPDRAWVQTPFGFEEIAPEQVRVGDLLLVKPGERVPLDGEVITGRSWLDTSALTGESKPQTVQIGDQALAGQINQSGALTLRVTRPFRESSVAKMLDLVENATARKAKTEKFITTFARWYTPAVVILAAAVAVAPPLILAGATFEEWIYRALVMLVISCPCALVISIPLGYFGGIGKASREGILIKGSNFLDVLSQVGTVVFDKTGTLTQGVFEVREIISLYGFSQEQLFEFAAAAEYYSNHPIARSILSDFAKRGKTLDASRIMDHTEISGKGVKAGYGEHTIFVGNDQLLHAEKILHDKCDFDATVAHIVVDGRYAGYITIGDALHPDAEQAVQDLRAQGVHRIAMLTGDNYCTAQAVGKHLGLDQVFADLLPEEKVTTLEQLGAGGPQRKKIAFVGDGINDAPVIARADVGIAMGASGSDAAIETADVVLMTGSPAKIVAAIAIARTTRTIVWQNIVLAFTIKGLFLCLGAMGLASMWEAVFADMGTALLAVVNSTRVLRGK